MTRERAERVAECVSVWVRRERTIDGGRVEEGVGRRRAAARARRTRNQRHEVPVQRRAPRLHERAVQRVEREPLLRQRRHRCERELFTRARIARERGVGDCRWTVRRARARARRVERAEIRSSRGLARFLLAAPVQRLEVPEPAGHDPLRLRLRLLVSARARSRADAHRVHRVRRGAFARDVRLRDARGDDDARRRVFGPEKRLRFFLLLEESLFVGNLRREQKRRLCPFSRRVFFKRLPPGRRDVVLDGEHRGEAPVRPRGRAEPEQRPEQAADQELARERAQERVGRARRRRELRLAQQRVGDGDAPRRKHAVRVFFKRRQQRRRFRGRHRALAGRDAARFFERRGRGRGRGRGRQRTDFLQARVPEELARPQRRRHLGVRRARACAARRRPRRRRFRARVGTAPGSPRQSRARSSSSSLGEVPFARAARASSANATSSTRATAFGN